jgi:hypothetical protein
MRNGNGHVQRKEARLHGSAVQGRGGKDAAEVPVPYAPLPSRMVRATRR